MKKKTDIEEIYHIFFKLGIDKTELNDWLKKIDIDRRKTEARIIDLALCVLIKKGLDKKHFNRLSMRLLPRRSRAKHLEDRINYLKENVISKK